MEGNLWLYRLYFRVVILLWLPVSLSAVDLPNLTFRTITISDGLSNNIINTIYKDKRGFIWLGTQTGLDRFDGINVKSFLQFSGRTIFSIAETDSVYLWVGTDKGLWKLDRKTDQVESVTLDTKSLEVRSVFVSQTGRLLVGTTHGLFIYQESAFRKVLFGSNALSSINFITGIVEGYKDTFWLTSQGGLIEYNIETGQSKVYTYQDDEKFVSYFSCLALLKEKLYLGTAGSGMLVFDIGKAAFSICPEVENGYIKSIITVNDEIWVGTNGSGIRIISASTGKELSAIEHTSNADAICSNAVYSLLKEDDMLWVGTYMGGLSYTPAHGSFFSVYSYPELFNSYNMNVRAFWVDADGKKVIGTRDGLYYISETEQRIRHYTHRNSILRSDIILSVKPFNRDFFIGTYGGGLYLLHRNTGELSFLQSDQCFMQGSFNGYERDVNNKLWIGSSKGVYVYDHLTGEYEVYNSRNSSLSVNSVFSLKADSKGRMWLGTGGAVFMYDRDDGVFKSDVFPEHVLPYTKSVRFIYEDKKKNLWFCDDKEGVVKVDESFTTFEHITIDDFLPNNSVMSIVEDPKNGGLWFATQRGLLYIKEEENYHKIFSLYDGIPGYIFNSPVQITDDNTIWWGNECGLVCYDAAKSWSEIGTKEVQPPVITSISVAGRPLCPGETLMPVSAPFIDEVFLSVNDNNISFTFSALNYAVENTDLYEYCLEEYDKEWKTLMKGNQVSYTELPVGDYMFRVRAASNPAAIKAVRVVVAGNTPFIRWIVVLSVVVCCILIYFYSGLLGKYRTMKEYINKKTESSEENRKEKYQKSRMEEKTAMLIIGKLNECMEKDRLYLNPDLKLQDVAKVVKCNTGELSQVLNMFMNIGFTDYVNKYRIDEFIKRIQDKSASRYTLVSLSEQCGFSSRTSFFRSFKKFKGMSPAEYIKEHGIFIE